MLVQDMKHACMEEIIELQRVDNEKKTAFKVKEAVKIVKQEDDVIVTSMSSSSNMQRFVPINEHTKHVVSHIMDVLELCLCEVVQEKKDSIQILVKQYPTLEELDVSVMIMDEFVRKKLAKQKQWTNVLRPYEELEIDSIYKQNEHSTYFIIGKHIHQNDNKQEEFIISAGDYYLSVKKCRDGEKEFYQAERFFRKVQAEKYKFMLVRGSLKFSSEKEEIKAQVRHAIGSIKDDLYIETWNAYGLLEAKIILDRIRKAGAVHFTSYEPDGDVVCFYLNHTMEEKLDTFAKFVKKGAMVGVLPVNPLHNTSDTVGLRNLLESKEVNQNIVDGKLADDINVKSGRISLMVNDENFERLRNFKEGYMFLSFKGDKRRLERREEARISIEGMTCPMTELNAVLEGRRGTAPKRTNIPALSPTLLKDPKYANLTPNQIEAIRIALNTPDIALIQGPPGTGKTTVITAIIKRLEEEADTEGGMFGRSLVTAFQHDAVQNATDRLKILGLPAIKFGKKYSDIEEDTLESNLSIQHWINEKIADLNVMHAEARDMEYMSEFHKLYVNYLKSAVTLEQTLTILKKIRDEVESLLSFELNEKLTSIINELQFLTKREDEEFQTLIRAVRRIPTNEIAMEDNGRGVIRRAILRLERVQDDYTKPYISAIKKMLSDNVMDYDKLRMIKKNLLVHIIPLEKIFTSRGKRDEIDYLLRDISDYLQGQIEASKKGEDLILLEYMQNLEENPMAVRKAILDYSVVNGATNQQVMSKEISALKGGNIVFDNVLVDEAARSNPLDLFIPMSVAKDRIILVGDHRQLPHIVDEEVVKELETNSPNKMLSDMIDERLKQSMFEQLFYKLQNLQEQEPKIPRVITLDHQFRMHPSIGTFINKNFYRPHGENVENGIREIEHFSYHLPGLNDKACIWYDVPLSLGKERTAKSKSRPIEARKIAEHLKNLLDSPKGKNYSYGIITFYRDQVDIINETLVDEEIGIMSKDDAGKYHISPNYWNNKYGDEEYIRVGTVDAFQGREFDVVYLSMVRANDFTVSAKPKEDTKSKKLTYDKELQHKYGFLMFENRLCVAMSRGKKVLICVGDSGMIQDESAQEAIPSLVDFYKLCKEDAYGDIIQ